MAHKFLITVAIILAVWYGFKWLDRRRKIIKGRDRGRVDNQANTNKGPTIENMIQCADCGAYVPSDGQHICS